MNPQTKTSRLQTAVERINEQNPAGAATYPSPTKNYTPEEWTTIVRELATKLAVTVPDGFDPANPALSDTCVTEFLQLNAADSPRPLRSLATQVDLSRASAAGFVCQHVEPLLQQAGRLLDRALATDREYFRLGVEQFNLRLELCQFFLLNNVHQAEIDAGIYNVPFLDADADLKVFQNSAGTAPGPDPSSTNSKIKAIFADGDVQNCLGNSARAMLRAKAIQATVNNAQLSGDGPPNFPGTVYNPDGTSGPSSDIKDKLLDAAALQVDYTFPLQNAMTEAAMTTQLLQIDNVEASQR